MIVDVPTPENAVRCTCRDWAHICAGTDWAHICAGTGTCGAAVGGVRSSTQATFVNINYFGTSDGAIGHLSPIAEIPFRRRAAFRALQRFASQRFVLQRFVSQRFA